MKQLELYQLLEELLSFQDEKMWLEFKLNQAIPEQIGEYISALSNGACIDNKAFGYLVWGVTDDTHTIKGTTFKMSSSRQGNQDLELWIRTLIHPKIHFEIYEFEYKNLPITLLRIPAAIGEPTHFQKRPFIRINSQKTDLRNHPALIRKIYNSQRDWSAQVLDAASINDLDKDAIELARKKFLEKQENKPNKNISLIEQIKKWDDFTLLDKMKITANGKITNTAIILLGKEESARFLLPHIAQIVWKLDTQEKSYEHYGPPFLVNINMVLGHIRNIRYKIFPDNQLVSTDVLKYETRVILEALNNCIAHQDYNLNSRIILTEKIDKLIFTNAGTFFEGSPEDYRLGEKTPEKYRNPWLAQAMVNLNMIDTLGYGIHTMNVEQRKRYFPLPDYTRSGTENVVLEIFGQVINENYSKLLLEKTDLPLSTVIMLDRIQKGLPLEKAAYQMLKRQKLIEGRLPNYHISEAIAKTTGQETEYLRVKGIDNDYIRTMIMEYITKFKKAKRADLEKLLLNKLPEFLTEQQKKDKIKNALQVLKREKKIKVDNSNWVPSN